MISISVEKVSKHVSIQTNDAKSTLIILDDVSLKIDASETVAIMGASGSGKSTLLGLMAGLDVPTEGRVLLNTINLSTLAEDRRATLRAKHIGFVFQQFYLIDNLTALENVWLPLEMVQSARQEGAGADTKTTEQPRKLTSDEHRQKAYQALEQVGLTNRMDHFPAELSGGEQQRVAIARAFALSPEILFADEPTGNLDTKTGDHIIQLLFELNEQQRSTLVFVTHDRHLSQRCKKQWFLEGGKLL